MKLIISILLMSTLAYAACPKTKVENQSTEAWSDRDTEEMNKAAKRCKEKYPNSPCLKRFVKRAHLTYWAICGAE